VELHLHSHKRLHGVIIKHSESVSLLTDIFLNKLGLTEGLTAYVEDGLCICTAYLNNLYTKLPT
jgi:hypothetical protein